MKRNASTLDKNSNNPNKLRNINKVAPELPSVVRGLSSSSSDESFCFEPSKSLESSESSKSSESLDGEGKKTIQELIQRYITAAQNPKCDIELLNRIALGLSNPDRKVSDDEQLLKDFNSLNLYVASPVNTSDSTLGDLEPPVPEEDFMDYMDSNTPETPAKFIDNLNNNTNPNKGPSL